MAIKPEKPVKNLINPETIADQVTACINEYCARFNIDLYNYNMRVNIKHNEVNNILRYCYNSLFKPSTGLMNNDKSIIDYDNIEQFTAVVNVFLDVCMMFNKSLGLFSFSVLTGIESHTLQRWISPEEQKLNPWRYSLLVKIQEYNKGALVSSLKDSPVGALAVANNDKETGLEWSKQQAPQIAAQTVYLIPSERAGRLGLEDHGGS